MKILSGAMSAISADMNKINCYSLVSREIKFSHLGLPITFRFIVALLASYKILPGQCKLPTLPDLN